MDNLPLGFDNLPLGHKAYAKPANYAAGVTRHSFQVTDKPVTQLRREAKARIEARKTWADKFVEWVKSC
jgi:hypothetical protein